MNYGMNSICWLLIFLICLILEIISLGLTTFWFAAGALVAFIATIVGADLIVQISLFIVVSLLLLFVTRPIAVKYLNTNVVKTNVDELIGKTAKVTVKIDNLNAKGEAVINSETWMARSDDDSIIEPGELVRIVAIKGVKLVVEKK